MTLWDDIIEPNLIYIEAAVLVAVAIILERLIARYLKRVSKGKEWPPHVTNGLVLIFRLLILLGAVATIMRIGGIPPDWLVAYSALGGAAIGFASQRTIGNFIAGLFVFINRPFRVNDYVRIDNVEGIVEEITFNFTKIRTPSNTTVLISNQRILDQDITNYRCEESGQPQYCYGIELTFDHSIPTDKLEKIFDGVIEEYKEKLPRKPWYVLVRITNVARHYMFYLYVESPEDVFTLQPLFVRDITEAWEKAKAKT